MARLRRADPTQRNDRQLPFCSQQCQKYPLTCWFGARGGIRTLDLPITRRMLGVDLVGSRRIEPAHVGWPVGPDGSRRIQKDRLDDQRMIKPCDAARPRSLRRRQALWSGHQIFHLVTPGGLARGRRDPKKRAADYETAGNRPLRVGVCCPGRSGWVGHPAGGLLLCGMAPGGMTDGMTVRRSGFSADGLSEGRIMPARLAWSSRVEGAGGKGGMVGHCCWLGLEAARPAA
jgi:hypothetical protein